MRIFVRLLLPWAALFLIINVCCETSSAEDHAQPREAGEGVSMRALWTVSEYRIGTNAAWGNVEANKLLFKPLDITATAITFNGTKCINILFNKEIVKTSEYLNNCYHVTPQFLDIADESVEVVKTDCSLPGFAEYFRLSDRRLVVHLKGVFFFFEPTVNY